MVNPGFIRTGRQDSHPRLFGACRQHRTLFSPQAYFKQHVDEPVVQKPKCTFNAHWLKLYTVDGNCLKLLVAYDPGNNLPYMFLDSHSHAAPASACPMPTS